MDEVRSFPLSPLSPFFPLSRPLTLFFPQATASVDFETDQKIQHVIRDEFAESLVLTVAHRLLTVVRGTHIIVLDAGRVVEYDTPANLLRNKEGVFRKMAEKASEWKELKEAAGLGEDE
jgi:ABC-type multidrug transport system fused ATPase/permease subunit